MLGYQIVWNRRPWAGFASCDIPRRISLMGQRRELHAVVIRVCLPNLIKDAAFLLIKSQRLRYLDLVYIAPAVTFVCPIDRRQHRTVLPRFSRFRCQRATVQPQHPAVSDIGQLQKLHWRNWLSISPREVENVIGDFD